MDMSPGTHWTITRTLDHLITNVRHDRDGRRPSGLFLHSPWRPLQLLKKILASKSSAGTAITQPSVRPRNFLPGCVGGPRGMFRVLYMHYSLYPRLLMSGCLFPEKARMTEGEKAEGEGRIRCGHR